MPAFLALSTWLSSCFTQADVAWPGRARLLDYKGEAGTLQHKHQPALWPRTRTHAHMPTYTTIGRVMTAGAEPHVGACCRENRGLWLAVAWLWSPKTCHLYSSQPYVVATQFQPQRYGFPMLLLAGCWFADHVFACLHVVVPLRGQLKRAYPQCACVCLKAGDAAWRHLRPLPGNEAMNAGRPRCCEPQQG